jgi:hypothetical protein
MITLFIADQITEQKSLVPNHNSLYFDVFWVHRFQSGWESSIFYILYIYGTILYNLVATLARKRMAGPRFPTHGRTLWLVRSGQIATTPRLGNGSSLLVFSSLDLSNECFYLHRHNIALHWMRSPSFTPRVNGSFPCHFFTFFPLAWLLQQVQGIVANLPRTIGATAAKAQWHCRIRFMDTYGGCINNSKACVVCQI